MQHLLNPISDELPCGDYLKNNRSAYRELRNSYNKALSSFRTMMESPDSMQNDELKEENRVNWSELSEICSDSLSSVSKDVEVFCWFITAQVFSEKPLENLRDSINALIQVSDQYWDFLNPKPPIAKLKSDNETEQKKEWAEIRVKPLIQLIGESENSGLLYMPLQNIEIAGGITYNQYCVAEIAGTSHELKNQLIACLPDERADICTKIELLADIQSSIETLDKLVNERCRESGASGISFQFLKNTFKGLINAFQFLFAEGIIPWPGQSDKTSEVEAVESKSSEEHHLSSEDGIDVNEETIVTPQKTQLVSSTEVIGAQQIVNRDQAFNELRKIADFFQRTEPHSPVYMLLERAIRWGYMSLPELLQEMVGENQPVMNRISQLAGLENTEKIAIPDVNTVAVSAQVAHQKTQAPEEPAQPLNTVETIADDAKEQSSSVDSGNSSGVSNFEW